LVLLHKTCKELYREICQLDYDFLQLHITTLYPYINVNINERFVGINIIKQYFCIYSDLKKCNQKFYDMIYETKLYLETGMIFLPRTECAGTTSISKLLRKICKPSITIKFDDRRCRAYIALALKKYKSNI
jgi:hypothetical protein